MRTLGEFLTGLYQTISKLEYLKRLVKNYLQSFTQWGASIKRLFDLCFFKNHMLSYNGVVLAEFHLFSRIAGVFLGDVIEPGVSGADQFNKYCARLCHGHSSTNK